MEFIDSWSAGIALTAGMLAAFNPCGFALLPAYMSLIITGTADEKVTRVDAVRRAILFGLAMTIGFMIVFIGFGLLSQLADSQVQGDITPYFAYVTVAVALVLVALGVLLALGREIKVPGIRMSGVAPTRSLPSQVGYGATFAIASLSCTIGPFLSVVVVALDGSNPVAVGLPFVIYAAGMGASIVAVSMIAAFAGAGAVASFRRHTPTIMRASGVLMIIAGIYVFFYGLAEVLQHRGNSSLDWILTESNKWRGEIELRAYEWGPTILTYVAIGVGLLAAWFLFGRNRDKASADAASNDDVKVK